MSTWNKKNFSIYTSDERSALGLIEELGNQTNYNTEEIEKVKESDNKKVSHDEMNRIYKIDKNADFTGSWHGIKKPTASQEGLQATVDKIVEEDIPFINSQIDTIESQRNITVILNQFSEIAKANTPDEDWSLAFNYVFSNFKKERCSLKVVFSGVLKVKSTINIPYGVSIEGSAHPYSQLVPSCDFVGDYVFKQKDNESHIELRNIYIAFEQNPNVGGFYIENPYDYSILDNLVGTNTQREFIRIGSPTNSRIGQTIKITNCICYGSIEGTTPLYAIYNHQEMYFENNKALFSDRTSSRIGILCDGVATSTFINNSVANCDKIALKISCDLYPKRIVGNLLIGNLFENTVPVSEEDGVIMITSGSGSASEGQNNQLIANHFMNSSDTIKLSNLTNTTVIGVGNVSGSRRTFHINPYNPAKNNDPYGNLEISADGGYLVGSFKGNLIAEDVKTTSVKSKAVSIKPVIGDSNKEIKMYWNGSDTDDYGYIIEKENSEILKFYANCWHLSSGAGIKLFSSDKSTSITLGCSNNGKLTVNGVEIN